VDGLDEGFDALPLPGTHKAYASATSATGYCAGETSATHVLLLMFYVMPLFYAATRTAMVVLSPAPIAGVGAGS